jgi:hypothetical protein
MIFSSPRHRRAAHDIGQPGDELDAAAEDPCRVRTRTFSSGLVPLARCGRMLNTSACSGSLNEFPIRSRPYAGLVARLLRFLARERSYDRDRNYGDSPL